jgi:hypothetical protein
MISLDQLLQATQRFNFSLFTPSGFDYHRCLAPLITPRFKSPTRFSRFQILVVPGKIALHPVVDVARPRE